MSPLGNLFKEPAIGQDGTVLPVFRFRGNLHPLRVTLGRHLISSTLPPDLSIAFQVRICALLLAAPLWPNLAIHGHHALHWLYGDRFDCVVS